MYLWRGLRPHSIVAAIAALNERPNRTERPTLGRTENTQQSNRAGAEETPEATGNAPVRSVKE